ncbi:MAG TPA: hypothetical protein VMA86_09130 [Acetobacteraceae bacterium]|nr:hypothetical protein [Acetobacteraceae bacterium]
MSSGNRALDEGTLVAFVDGELDPAAARDVARLLAEDPVAQKKVELLRRSTALVHAAFAGPEWEEVPPRLARLVAGPPVRREPDPRGRRQFGMAVAASVAAIAGIAGGLGIHAILAPEPSPAAHLMDEVAEYHTVFARESHGFDILPASAAPRIESWFADVLGRRISIPDLGSFGLAFRGARLLVVGGRPVTQFLYAARGSSARAPRHPFGVCVTAWPDADQTLTTARRDGVGLALWARDGYAYVLVGWMKAAELDRIAEAIRPALESA